MRDLLFDRNNYVPDPQTSDMRQIRKMMPALPLASTCLKKLWILCLNDLLDGDLCKNLLYFDIFSVFLVFKHDLSDVLIIPVSQLQTQQMLTPLIRSHIEYLLQTYYILVLIM